MTRAQYEKRLAELEAEADRRGCCVIPAKPLREPRREGRAPSRPRPGQSRALPRGKKEAK